MIDNWLSKTKLKEGYERLVLKIFHGRISANILTILGFGIGLLGALFIFLSGQFPIIIGFWIISIVLMIISFVFDTFDGPIARANGPSKFGGILDIFCDRAVEVLIIIAIVSTDTYKLIFPGLFSLAAIVLCISMFLLIGSLMDQERNSPSKKLFTYRIGLMERSETFLFLLLILILIPWRFFLLWLFALLVFITAILRLRDAYQLFK